MRGRLKRMPDIPGELQPRPRSRWNVGINDGGVDNTRLRTYCRSMEYSERNTRYSDGIPASRGGEGGRDEAVDCLKRVR